MLRFFLIVLSTSLSLTIHAQDSLSGYIFNQLDQRKSLSDYEVSFFHQDRIGYLWMSSNSGFYRFDGKKAKIYRPNNLTHNFNPIVNSNIFEDQQGNRWFSTIGGLHRIDHQYDTVASHRLYSASEKKYLSSSKLFYLDNPNKINEELWVYDDSTWYKVSLKNPTQAKPYKKLIPGFWRIVVIKDKNQQAFALAGSFLRYGFYLHYLNQSKKKPAVILKEHMIANLINEGDSLLWIASMSGLIQYDLQKDKLKNLFPPLPGKSGFSNVSLWTRRHLILSSIDRSENIFRFDKSLNARNRFTPMEEWKKVEGNFTRVMSVDKSFVDRRQNLWLVNWRTGLYSTNLKKSYFEQIIPSKPDFVPGQSAVSNICVDPAGTLWFVTNYDLVYSLYKSAEKKPLELISTSRKMIRLAPDFRRGGVWAVMGDSLKQFNKGHWKAAMRHDSPIIEIDLTPDGQLLARTDNGFTLINVHTQTRTTVYKPQHKLLDITAVNSVFIDQKSRCFINQKSQELLVYQLEGKNLKFIDHYSNMGRVNSVIKDIKGAGHWVASSAGLFKIKKGEKPLNFAKIQKSLNQGFNGVLQDHQGKLWLSTNDGILCFNPQNNQIQIFSESDGTIGGQYVMGMAAQTRAGKLFFGSTNGVNVIEPKKLIQDSTQPQLICEQILVNGHKWNHQFNLEKFQQWKFAPNERNLTFFFSTLDFISPNENQFKYRLIKRRFGEGFLRSQKSNWVDLGTNSTFTLSDLSKGNYILEVLAANSDGIWMNSDQSKRYHFRIQPHFWETGLFKGASFLLLIGSIYWANRSRIRRIQRNAHLVETELKVLRLQMNPHFIYNCLASIQRFVLVAKVDEANGLITSFAKLMRKILNDSVKSNLLIAEEIELLESYLLTEALRLDHKFDYTIEVDDQLDPEEIAVPTMILQPFVENAIIHGMSKLNGKGLVRIFFRPIGEMLECIVEDNGMGLSKSLNQNHESKAIVITERRLKLLPKTGTEAASLSIVDRSMLNPEETGVRVSIKLPMNLTIV